MKTNIYVDAFNLYYGCLKNTPYKWLNLLVLCQKLLPQHNIKRIKYFTALVSARPHDLDQPVRQLAYFRALETLPQVSIIKGHFLSSTAKMPLKSNPAKKVEVLKTEEKGSDVNLATHLLIDGFRQDYEVAVVISNDSDLLTPIQFVRQDLGLKVGLLNPHKRPSAVLVREVDFIKPIRSGVLSVSQFPATLTDKNGTFTKPARW